MGLARRIGHLTYRTEIEMHQRFSNRAQEGENPLGPDRNGRYAIASYLDHAAARLTRRFDPNTYLAINEAMNHHDIGRDRGGVQAAMTRITAALTIVGMEEDRLYPIRLQKALASLAPRQRNGQRVELQSVRSVVGHDAFLTEDAAMSAILRSALG